MLIQFPIIFGLLDVVYRPLTHLLHISSTAMEQAKQIAVGIIGTNATSLGFQKWFMTLVWATATRLEMVQ
mgnify:CR=1 FL=1